MPPPDLLVLSLFAWYTAYVLVKTSGPFDAFKTLRARVTFMHVLDCMYCTSVWMAALGYVLMQSPYIALAHIGAIAGGAMILHRWTGGEHG